jgi:hypothetical protein
MATLSCLELSNRTLSDALSLPPLTPRRSLKLPTCVLSKTNDENKIAILHGWLKHGRQNIDYIPDYILADHLGNVNVRVRVHIMSIHNVSTVDQSFDAKVWIQFKWSVHKSLDTIDVSRPGATEWCPQFEVLNNISKLNTDTKMHKVARGPLKTDLYCRTVFHGTFAEHFELQKFPIDVERLHICLVFWQCPISVKRPYPQKSDPAMEIFFPRHMSLYQLPSKNIVYTESFVQRDTWELSPQMYLRQTRTRADRNDEGVRFPCLDIYAVVTRKVGFYMYNVVVPIFLLVLMSLVSFVVDVTELSARLSITLTLLLTLVALKYVVAQYLPTTCYLTYLDKYILISFGFLSIVSGQNVIVGYLATKIEDDEAEADNFPLVKATTSEAESALIHGAHPAYMFNRISGLLMCTTWVTMHIFMVVMLYQPLREKITGDVDDDEDEEVRYNLPEEAERSSLDGGGRVESICY